MSAGGRGDTTRRFTAGPEVGIYEENGFVCIQLAGDLRRRRVPMHCVSEILEV